MEKRMKIAFDHQIFTYQSYGGISRYYKVLIENLLSLNQDVRVFAGLHQNNYISNLPSNCIKGIKFNKYPNKTIRAFQLINHIACQAQIKTWKPDLVHETYYSERLDLRTNAAKITTVYDMIHELYSSNFPSKDKTTYLKKKTFKRVDHIISISSNTKKDLVKLFNIDESKISVVHLGVDLNIFEQYTSSKLKSVTPYILFVGARGEYKNFSGFLKACSSSAIIKNKINILAFGGGDFSKEELLMIEKLGFNDGVIQHVSGDDRALAGFYANALCFVYPSIYEGFGLPPLEAMASGCPVISSNSSSMPEVINNAGEYFDPNIKEEMIYAIEKVITSESRQKELIELGKKNAKLFSWKKCSDETLKIYEKFTGNI